MDEQGEQVLQGVFAVAKPAQVSSADVLQKLQSTFASSALFAPLRKLQPIRTSKSDDQVFRMGHGGTLDPLATGVLIVGIGRGTKHLQQYLACSKTYETVVLFGASTDTYDCTGVVTNRGDHKHVTKDVVERNLAQFRGTFQQHPPIFSALKINGIKACEYARQGLELPRQLESRQMHVDECTLTGWYEAGEHDLEWPDGQMPALAPAARIRLTVCSGFYVRSFAHDLGLACRSYSHMVALSRTRQAAFTVEGYSTLSDQCSAISYAELEAGEKVWGSRLRPQLETWVQANPLSEGHTNGRDQDTKRRLAAERAERPKQRFRGEWTAESKHGRIKQQGGKFKGKWGRGTAGENVTLDYTETESKKLSM